jgi:Tol biopolymer transport system component
LAGIATGASSPVVATELLPRTELVSVSSNEERGNDASISPAISADGSRIAFASSATNLVADDTNGIADIFVRNLSPGTTARVSLTSDGREIEGGIGRPAISGNGQWVAYSSDADGIVPGDDNHVYDVFLRSLPATNRNSARLQGDTISTPY